MDNLKGKLTKRNVTVGVIVSLLLFLVTFGVYTIVQDMKAASASPLIYNESHDLP